MKINALNSIPFKAKTFDYGQEFKKMEDIVEKNKDSLTPEALELISNSINKSPYYTPSEYLSNFLYFKNYQLEGGGYPLFNTIESVKNKSANNALKIDPCSVDASYFEIATDLMNQGLLNPDAMLTLQDNFVFNEDLKKDIDIYCEVAANNKNKDTFFEELDNAYVPEVSSEKEGLEITNTGDAFLVKDEEYIRIKTAENKSEQMKIDKANYIWLFPLFDRFATAQGELSDCFLLETLEMLYSKPTQRAQLLKLFSQDNEGNLYITIKDTKTKFENAQLPKEEDEYNYPQGAEGYSLLEYAYGNYYKNFLINLFKDNMEGKDLEEFEDFLKKNGDNIFLTLIPTQKDDIYAPFYQTLDEAKESGYIKQAFNFSNVLNIEPKANTFIEYLIGNCGSTTEIQNALDYKISYTHTDKSIQAFTKALLKSKNYMNDHFVTAVIKNHLYGVEMKKDKDNKTVYHLYNPINQGVPEEVSVDELLQKSSKIIFTKLK